MSKSKLTIGSDCEFGFVNKITKLQEYANEYIERQYGYSGNHVGLDGHNHIAEIRTAGGNISPIGHANDLRRILANFQKEIPETIIPVAGSMVGNDPIGGHIHFGYCNNDFSPKIVESIKDYGDVLDLFLAIPSLLVENNKTARRRRTSNYGKLSDARLTDYGFEYRTLPSWLVSFGFAQSLLSLAYVLVDHLLKGGKMVGFSDLGTGAAEKFYIGSRNYFYRLLPKLHKEITKCPLYDTYSVYINALFGFIKAFNQINPKKDWIEKVSFTDRWNIEKYRCYWKLSYSTKDYKMKEVLVKISNSAFSIPIRIYGISAKTEKKFSASGFRPPFIFYSRSNILPELAFGDLSIYKNMNTENRVSDKSIGLWIGISYSARKRHLLMCSRFLDKVLYRFKIKNPNPEIKLITIMDDMCSNEKEEELIESPAVESPVVSNRAVIREALPNLIIGETLSISANTSAVPRYVNNYDDMLSEARSYRSILSTAVGRHGSFPIPETHNVPEFIPYSVNDES